MDSLGRRNEDSRELHGSRSKLGPCEERTGVLGMRSRAGERAPPSSSLTDGMRIRKGFGLEPRMLLKAGSEVVPGRLRIGEGRGENEPSGFVNLSIVVSVSCVLLRLFLWLCGRGAQSVGTGHTQLVRVCQALGFPQPH
jgi:hypothetical protein